ncbi:MAG: hypothetical protein ACREFD_13930, partial [Stellaceae bacterium]
KILDTDLLAFEARASGLRATDLMQGPVYGHASDAAAGDPALMPHFHYDDIFGTVLNRFVTQAVAGVPLTVYGSGAQVRGYIDLNDTLRCIELVSLDPPPPGELRIFNQFTELFSIGELAARVAAAGRAMGFEVTIGSVVNPRPEQEEHFYQPAHDGLRKLSFVPRRLGDARLAEMIEFVARHRAAIDPRRIMPRISWSGHEPAP